MRDALANVPDTITRSQGLRWAEAAARVALAVRPVGLWAWDASTDAIWWTTAMGSLHGLQAPDMPESLDAYLRIVVQEDRARVRQTMIRSAQAPEDFTVNYGVGLPDGTVRRLECMGSTVSQGETRRMVGFCLDVTELRREEEPASNVAAPILPLDAHVFLCPLVGLIDHHRAASVATRLPQAVHERKARVVVLDMTGVSAITPKALDDLEEMIAAIHFLGAITIVTGISPLMARFIIDMHGSMEGVIVERDLQAGIRRAKALQCGD